MLSYLEGFFDFVRKKLWGRRCGDDDPSAGVLRQYEITTTTKATRNGEGGKGLVTTSVRFTRPKYSLVSFYCPGVMALMAGTHPRCGARSPVSIVGQPLIRGLVDLVALALTELRLVVEAWGLFQCRGSWRTQFCFRMSPLFGVTGDVAEPASRHYWEQRDEQEWWQSENGLWTATCHPKLAVKCASMQGLILTSKWSSESAVVPFDAPGGRALVRFIGFDYCTPNELLLIVSQPGPVRNTAVHMIIDMERSFTTKTLVVLSKASFDWQLQEDTDIFEVKNAVVMRKPHIGRRIFLSHIEWSYKHKHQVIESLEALWPIVCHQIKVVELVTGVTVLTVELIGAPAQADGVLFQAVHS
ncbi:hypothetical protein Pelo_13693 [Pelomyxa schiedti]|nr:hypothetical protein Pelo_13693 [Pelomyxa schiedti]